MGMITLMVCSSLFLIGSAENSNVVVSLYDTVTLPCTFPFIRGSEGLMVLWEKNGGERKIVHKYVDGQDHLKDQNIHYIGRTELSKDFSGGLVELKLKNLTYADEGTYYCRALNKRGHGDQKVKIIINGLNAEDPLVTVTHIEGKKRLKCIGKGVFRVPEVKWYDKQSTDLSEHGILNVTVLRDGRKLVESILDLHVDINIHYFCQVKEGRLKRTTRAVISDGNPVTVTETKLPE